MDCSHPVGVIRLPDSGRGLGIALGCQTHLMKLDAEVGAFDSIAYPALQLAAKGFHSRAVTDCLNFGNPENPQVMSEFVVSVESISALCKALDAPVISGNVSFYNETLGQSIASTPATALVGLRGDVDALPQSTFQKAGSAVFLLEHSGVQIVGKNFSGSLDAESLAEFIANVRQMSYDGGVLSTRVVGRKGLPVALAKMCSADLGILIDESEKMDSSETLYQVIVEVTAESAADFTPKAKRIGTVQKGSFAWDGQEVKTTQIVSALQDGWRKSFGLS